VNKRSVQRLVNARFAIDRSFLGEKIPYATLNRFLPFNQSLLYPFLFNGLRDLEWWERSSKEALIWMLNIP
jgi:hypothetical protein